MARNALIQHRGDTAANWTSVNPVLAAREIGLETDTKKIKFGDGTTAWTSLGYMSAVATSAWGGITGTLSAQTDLNTALSNKQPLATVLTNTTAAFTTAQETKLAGIATGATANVGTVTSVGGTGTVNGLTLTGTVTSSGSLTLGGTLSGVNLTTQVTGTLPLANGGTGATTAAAARTNLGLGTSATTDSTSYATAAQGTKADTAVQTIGSTDGSVTVTGTTAIDLSAVSTATVLLPVRNATGSTLTKGTAVYISGATGQIPTVSKALATTDATSAQTMGLISADLPNNTNGTATLIGTISNIDTSAFSDGAQLYLSPSTAGALTATKPSGPDHLVYVAVVAHSHATQGKLFVKVQNGYEIDEIHDVKITGTPAAGSLLIRNATGSLWENATITAGSGITVTNGDKSITIASTGSMVYPGAGITVSTGSAWGTSLTAPSGAIVGTTDTQTLTNKKVTPRVISYTSLTTPWAWNSDSYDQLSMTALANDITISADAGTPADGQKVLLRIKDNGTARALTWTTGASKAFRAVGTTLPTTTVINKTVYIGCVYNSADARWDVVAVAQEA